MLQNYNSRVFGREIASIRSDGQNRLMLQLAHIMIILCELNMPDQFVKKNARLMALFATWIVDSEYNNIGYPPRKIRISFVI